MTAYSALTKTFPLVATVAYATVALPHAHGQTYSSSSSSYSSSQSSTSITNNATDSIKEIADELTTGKVIGATIGGAMAGATGMAVGAVAGTMQDNTNKKRRADQNAQPDPMALGNPDRYKKDSSLGFDLPVVDPGQLNHAQRITVTGRAHIVDGNIDKARNRALSDAMYNAAMKQNVELASNSIMTDGAIQRESMLMRSKSAILEHRVLDEKQEHGVYIIKIEAIIADPYSTKVCTNAGLRKTLSLYKIGVRWSETVDTPHLGMVRKTVNKLLPTLQENPSIRLLNRTNYRFKEQDFKLALSNMLYEDLATAGGRLERRGMILTGDVVVKGNRQYKNLAKEKFVNIAIDLKLINASDLKIRSQYNENATIRTERRPVMLKWYMNEQVGRGETEVANFINGVFNKMINAIECAPLQTQVTMIKGQDIYLNVGQDSGVRQGQMLFVPEQTAPSQMRADLPMGKDWRMMEIVRVDMYGSVARMIEQEKTSQVKVGYKVQFLN